MPLISTGRFFFHGLSLRTKTFLFLGVGMVVLMACFLFLVSAFLSASAGSLQNELTTQRIDGVIRSLDQIVRQQRRGVSENAAQDETFDFFSEKAKDREGNIFHPKTGVSGQSFVLFFDRKKNLSNGFAPVPGDLRGKMNLPPYFNADQAGRSGLLEDGKTGSSILSTPDGLLVLSAHPVTRAGGSEQSPGWLVYGLHVGSEWFEEMQKDTGATISPAYPPGQMTDMNMQQGETLNSEALGECRVFISQSDLSGNFPGEIAALIEFQNTMGDSPAGLHLILPSTVFSTIQTLKNRIVWTAILFGAVFSVFGLIVTEILFIRKIVRMDGEFQTLDGKTDSSTRLPGSPRDEFVRLAGSANRLLDSLGRRRMEAETREEVLLSVLDSSSEGIMAFKSLRNEKGAICDFILVLANKAAEAIVNCKAENMLGKCLLGLFTGNMGQGAFDRYVQVVETRTGEHFEIFHGQEDARSWFHIFAEPWKDGFVATFEEIGARKRVEQELKASIEELERFNRAMIGRENRILEMKSEVNRLRARLGLQPEYKVDSFSDEP